MFRLCTKRESAPTSARPPIYSLVKKILLTGMSGTGKSTLISELANRGYKAVDLDADEWSDWTLDSAGEPDWTWREDRIHALLSTNDTGVLFLSGCATNQGKFYPQLDHVILLSAPTPVLRERLATRTTNSYGKHPDELDQVLGYVQTVEPLLRRTASLEVDTSIPIEQVVETILTFLLGNTSSPPLPFMEEGVGG
jgi:shikimate kinase